MSDHGIEHALILAAGEGRRLLPITKDCPKPLLPVNGTPILENCLRLLASVGIKRVTIVVGHLSGCIAAALGRWFAGLDIEYVQASRYSATNNVVSAWEARGHLDADSLIVEGDVFFKRAVLVKLLASKHANAMLVDVMAPGMTGAAVSVDADWRVRELRIIARGQPRPHDLLFKTVSIQRLSRAFLQCVFLPEVGRAVAAGQVQEFYEIAIGRVIDRGGPDIFAVPCDPGSWIEIDDPIDYAMAQVRFSERTARDAPWAANEAPGPSPCPM